MKFYSKKNRRFKKTNRRLAKIKRRFVSDETPFLFFCTLQSAKTNRTNSALFWQKTK